MAKTIAALERREPERSHRPRLAAKPAERSGTRFVARGWRRVPDKGTAGGDAVRTSQSLCCVPFSPFIALTMARNDAVMMFS